MNTSVEFDLTFKQVEECSRELEKLYDRSTAGFLRTPKGVSLVRGVIAALFFLFIAIPLAVILEGGAKIHGWLLIYFTVVSWLLGALTMAIALQPVDVDVLSSLLFTKGKRSVCIAEGGLECKLNDTIALTPWSAFSKVVLGQSFIFLAKTDGFFEAVPLAGFVSQQAADEFAIELNKRIRAVPSNP
jgi:hypothetical protein